MVRPFGPIHPFFNQQGVKGNLSAQSGNFDWTLRNAYNTYHTPVPTNEKVMVAPIPFVVVAVEPLA